MNERFDKLNRLIECSIKKIPINDNHINLNFCILALIQSTKKLTLPHSLNSSRKRN